MQARTQQSAGATGPHESNVRNGLVAVTTGAWQPWHMTEPSLPPSDFLRAVIRDEVSLTGSEEGGANLKRLIDMTRDEHPENRDWAALLLAQLDIDTQQVRDALIAAAQDESAVVRAEAILGLAHRDRALALPLIQKELGGDSVVLPIFDAAVLVADASLVDDLRAFASPSGNADLDKRALEAVRACEAAQATQ